MAKKNVAQIAPAGSMLDYWDRAHQARSIPHLTNSSLDRTIDFLRAREKLVENQNVLCIGVGTGEWMRELKDRYSAVTSAVDISPTALQVAVKGGATAGYLPSELHKLPSNHFDLALSLWVTPHMYPNDFHAQLHHVLRALKPTGVFAVHYNEPTGGRILEKNVTDLMAKSGLVLYSTLTIGGWAGEVGGQIVAGPFREAAAPQYSMDCIALHIARST